MEMVSQLARATFADWKEANGFGTPADAEASAIYMTHTDLGFGRHMHMRRKGRHVAFYVDNYPSIEDAIAGTRFFATVAMEYSPGPGGTATSPYFTQFYVYNKRGERITDPLLDDHGPIPSGERTFDELARAVRLRFLPYSERANWRRRVGACVADRIGDRIGTQGQSADGIHHPLRVPQRLQTEGTNEREPIGAHCGEPRVDV